MKTFLLAIFAATAVVAFALEDCFTEDAWKTWTPMREACQEEIPEDAEDRLGKLFQCMHKKTGIVSADGSEIDYNGKFKEAFAANKARDLSHVLEATDACWNSNHDTEAFLKCYIPVVNELCPDVQKASQSFL